MLPLQYLKWLNNRIGKILWLNPLPGREGYTLEADMMEAIVPMLDRLAPAHGVESLDDVGAYLATL